MELGETQLPMQPQRQSNRAYTTCDGRFARSENGCPESLDRLLGEGEEPRPGTHIISPRRGYLHHGVYVGAGRVVHYAGMAHGLFRGPVEDVSLAQFARGRDVWVRWRGAPAFDRVEIVGRARSRVGENRYQILHNNCEHFCEWCIHGEPRSYQVERLRASRRALAIILGLIGRWAEVCTQLRLRPHTIRSTCPLR
jgi:hypothetical protein